MTLRAVFFDLDGTFLDTARDLAASLNHILLEDGLPLIPANEARQLVSNGAYALIKKGYNLSDNDSRIETLRQRLLDHYGQNLCKHTAPFAGIEALVDQLSKNNIAWGIATNKPKAYAEPLMAEFELASKPCCVLSPEHVQNKKPHPESLYLACELAQCQTNEAIYIGDHKRDIDCGINAGMVTVAVNYGYIPEGEDIQDWHADYTVQSATELWPIIQSYI